MLDSSPASSNYSPQGVVYRQTYGLNFTLDAALIHQQPPKQGHWALQQSLMQSRNQVCMVTLSCCESYDCESVDAVPVHKVSELLLVESLRVKSEVPIPIHVVNVSPHHFERNICRLVTLYDVRNICQGVVAPPAKSHADQ